MRRGYFTTFVAGGAGLGLTPPPTLLVQAKEIIE